MRRKMIKKFRWCWNGRRRWWWVLWVNLLRIWYWRRVIQRGFGISSSVWMNKAVFNKWVCW